MQERHGDGKGEGEGRQEEQGENIESTAHGGGDGDSGEDSEEEEEEGGARAAASRSFGCLDASSIPVLKDLCSEFLKQIPDFHPYVNQAVLWFSDLFCGFGSGMAVKVVFVFPLPPYS